MMRVVLTVCSLAMAAACTTPPPPLSSTFDSPEALGRAVLAAFQTGDREALLQFALTEQEFRQRVWPELPSARPERNLPFSYVWGDLKQKSDASLSRLLDRYRGRGGSLTQVRFEDASTPYQTFVVHRKSVFAIRADGGEATEEIRLCGSMIEQAGRWKVFSYVVDD